MFSTTGERRRQVQLRFERGRRRRRCSRLTVIRPAILDLFLRVRSAHGDDRSSRRDSSSNPRGRVLEDDGVLARDTKLLGGEEEGVGEGLSRE